jgi:hypothetical protein
MPIDYTRDDSRRLVTITSTDPFVFSELLDLVDRQRAEGVWTYAVLYDSRQKRQSSSVEQLLALVERVRTVGGGQRRGPVGVALPLDTQRFESGVLFSVLAGHEWEIEVLLTDEQVDDWVTRAAPVRSSALQP